MARVKKPKYTEADLGINPCSIPLSIPVRKVTYENQYKWVDNMLVPIEVEMEYTQFTKVYISSERRLMLSALPPCSKELLLWIILEVEAGEQTIWINKPRYLKENDTSILTYKKAIEGLVRYAVLAYTIKPDVFWINPDYFFHGNRVAKYPKNITLV